MELPELPKDYFWDSYVVKGKHGHARVTQLRKKVILFFSRPVGDRKVEVIMNSATLIGFGANGDYAETKRWAEDMARNLRKDKS